MTSSTVFHHIRKLAIWASGKSNRHSATFNYIWFYSLILSSLGLPGIQAPEGLHAKFDDLWQLCRDHPDIQVMLDEAVKGRQGRRLCCKNILRTENFLEKELQQFAYI
jgi:hypothetical protein